MGDKIVKYDWKIIEEVKAYVISETIKGQLIKRRYRLDITLKRGNKNKIALFIMMNPSRADAEVADDTIKKIITYINKRADDTEILNNIGRIIFVNLYVVYETVSNKVNNWIDLYGMDFVMGIEEDTILNNDKIIKEAIKEADVIFAAWGEGDILDYEERINQINKFLKSKIVFCIGKPTQKGFPRHLSRINYKWEIKKFK